MPAVGSSPATEAVVDEVPFGRHRPFCARDLVFCREDGKPIHPQKLTESFSRHRKAAGIPTGTLHVLRHSAATLALTAGVPLHVVAARIGDDPRVVLATYAHLLPTSDAEAAERVAALLGV